jgi:hypothetical protein
MAGTPDPDQAIVVDRKIPRCLLSSTHPAGRAKAAFFRGLGSGHRQGGVYAMRSSTMRDRRIIVSVSDTPFGKKYRRTIDDAGCAQPAGSLDMVCGDRRDRGTICCRVPGSRS